MKLQLPRLVREEGHADIILDIYQEDERMICAVWDLKAEIKAPPKRWLQIVREELRVIEDEARKANCVELRMVGRFSEKMFPDYEPYEPLSGLYGIRKGL